MYCAQHKKRGDDSNGKRAVGAVSEPEGRDPRAEVQAGASGRGRQSVGNTIIFDYKTGFPKPKAVIGYDHDKEQRLRERYETQMRKMEKDCEETERWVESIPESQTRRIFRMRFIEGDTQQKIGEKLHMERSTVSKRIEAFLKVSHKSHNSHL